MDIPSSEVENRMIAAMCLWENFPILRNHPNHRSELNTIPLYIARALVRGLVIDCLAAWKEIETLGSDAIAAASPYDSRFCYKFLVTHLHRVTGQEK